MDNNAESWVGKKVEFTKVVSASIEKVWSCWTDQERMANWWGPDMFTTTICEADPVLGGHIYIVFEGPTGKKYPMMGTYVEFDEHKRIVFDSSPIGEDNEVLITTRQNIEFEDLGDTTALAVTIEVISVTPLCSAISKWNGSWMEPKLGEASRICSYSPVKICFRTINPK